MQFDAKLTHSLCHVFYATTLQISRLRQEIADLKSKLESTEDNFNKLRAEHTEVLSRLEEYEEAGDVPSASDPDNYNKDGKRTRKAGDRSRFLWEFVQRYACGVDFACYNYVNARGWQSISFDRRRMGGAQLLEEATQQVGGHSHACGAICPKANSRDPTESSESA